MRFSKYLVGLSVAVVLIACGGGGGSPGTPNGSTPQTTPTTNTADFTFCHTDAAYAQEVAERSMACYLRSLLEHYELMDDHLLQVKGYEGYGKQAGTLKAIGFDKYLGGFLAANAYGTPEQMLAKFRERRETIGDFDLATCFRFGGMSIEDSRASMALFAREVMPVLKSW